MTSGGLRLSLSFYKQEKLTFPTQFIEWGHILVAPKQSACSIKETGDWLDLEF